MAADELQHAQATLERALARSKAGEDRVLMAQVRERGEQFANLLSGLIRMGHIHAADNHAFDQPVADLHRALEALSSLLGSVQVVTVEDQVYINDVRMKTASASGPNRDLGGELHKHNVGGLTFFSPPGVAELRALVGLLGGRPAPEHPRSALEAALREAGLTQVELSGIYRFRMSADEAPPGTPSAQAPGSPGGAAGAPTTTSEPGNVPQRISRQVDETWDNLATGRQVNVLALRRLIDELLQTGPTDERLWAYEPSGMSRQGWHGFRVAHVTLLLAQALGLPAGLQQDYGVAALMHDVGYAAPTPSAHTVRGHGIAGVRGLLRQLGFHEAKVRRCFVALHHHDDLLVAGKKVPLAARLLRVAEDYENFTRPLGGGLTPPEALGQLAAGAGRHYDPVIVQLLINALGAYPPGTFLGLEDGRVVKSVSCARSPQAFATPRAQVLQLPGGAFPAPGTVIDLAAEGKVARWLKPRAH